MFEDQKISCERLWLGWCSRLEGRLWAEPVSEGRTCGPHSLATPHGSTVPGLPIPSLIWRLMRKAAEWVRTDRQHTQEPVLPGRIHAEPSIVRVTYHGRGQPLPFGGGAATLLLLDETVALRSACSNSGYDRHPIFSSPRTIQTFFILPVQILNKSVLFWISTVIYVIHYLAKEIFFFLTRRLIF